MNYDMKMIVYLEIKGNKFSKPVAECQDTNQVLCE